MKRGDILIVTGGKDRADNLWPVAVGEGSGFDEAALVTFGLFTTDGAKAPLFRAPVDPNENIDCASCQRRPTFSVSALSVARKFQTYADGRPK